METISPPKYGPDVMRKWLDDRDARVARKKAEQEQLRAAQSVARAPAPDPEATTDITAAIKAAIDAIAAFSKDEDDIRPWFDLIGKSGLNAHARAALGALGNFAAQMNAKNRERQKSIDELIDSRRLLLSKNVELEHEIKLLKGRTLYKGVWTGGVAYDLGDFVTRQGSVWHSNEDNNTSKPGESPYWTLAVKAGRDGRDAEL